MRHRRALVPLLALLLLAPWISPLGAAAGGQPPTSVPLPTSTPLGTITTVLTPPTVQSYCVHHRNGSYRATVRGYYPETIITTFGSYGALFSRKLFIPTPGGGGLDFPPGVDAYRGIYVYADAPRRYNVTVQPGWVEMEGLLHCRHRGYAGNQTPWISEQSWHRAPPLPLPPGSSATTTSHGLKLTLTVPQPIYPRNALVRVSVRLRNVSPRIIHVLQNYSPVCPVSGTNIRITTQAGKNVYPAAIAWALPSCGSPLTPTPLQPGQVITASPLVILRGSLVQALVSVGQIEVATPIIHLRLIDSPGTPFTLIGKAHMRLTIPWLGDTRPSPFSYIESMRCLPHTGNGSGTGDSDWKTFSGSLGNRGFHDFYSCDGHAVWSFAGGWLGQPVVQFTRQT